MPSPHSEFISVTRGLAQVTNQSPNAIRVAMRNFIRQQTEAQSRAAATPSSTVPVSQNLPPDPSKGEMGFASRPFTPAEGQGRGQGSSLQDGTILADVVYYDTSDDTLYYTDIYTTGRKDAV